MDCSQGSVCIEVIKLTPTALIAFAVAIISARQYFVARDKFNLDLYQRRYPIFDATWAFLSDPIKATNSIGQASKFSNIIPEARFLFGDDIANYMSHALDQATRLKMLELRTRANNNVLPAEFIDEHYDLQIWFHNQAVNDVKDIFYPYLNFSAWGGNTNYMEKYGPSILASFFLVTFFLFFLFHLPK